MAVTCAPTMLEICEALYPVPDVTPAKLPVFELTNPSPIDMGVPLADTGVVPLLDKFREFWPLEIDPVVDAPVAVPPVVPSLPGVDATAVVVGVVSGVVACGLGRTFISPVPEPEELPAVPPPPIAPKDWFWAAVCSAADVAACSAAVLLAAFVAAFCCAHS